MRRLASLVASFTASASPSWWVTPTSASRPGPMAPTTSPSTVTDASRTRCTTDRTGLGSRIVLELRAGSATAVVDAEGGGRLTRLHAGDAELLAPEGSFVMAPWAGRTGYGRFTWQGVEHH